MRLKSLVRLPVTPLYVCEIGVKNSEFRMQYFLEGLIVFNLNYAYC